MKILAYLYLVFFVYSFLGYVWEVIYMAWENKKLVNRGFLCGPLLPIYGFGAIFILYSLTRYKSNPVIIYVFGVIIGSALEYFTSFLLEKIFHNMWWDYCNEKYNINGRICLESSLLFGVAALVVIYIGNPLLNKVLKLFSLKLLNIFIIITLIIFIIDVIYSVIVAFNLRNRLIIVEELKKEKLSKIPLLFERTLKKRVAKFKIYPTRLLKAFPRLDKGNVKAFTIMQKEKLKKRKK